MKPVEYTRRQGSPADARALRAGKALNGIAALVVMMIGLVLWHLATRHIELTAQRQFEQDTQRVVDELGQRIRSRGDYLTSLIVAAERKSESPGQIPWRGLLHEVENAALHAESSELGMMLVAKQQEMASNKLIRSVGGFKLSPHPLQHADQDFYLPVIFANGGSKSSALAGKDLSRSPRMLAAAKRARDSGAATLVARAAPGAVNSAIAFNVLVPFYNIASATTVRDRQHQFAGLLYASLDIGSILKNHPSLEQRYALSVHIGDSLVSNPELAGMRDTQKQNMSRRVKLGIFDENWTFDFTSRTDASGLTANPLPLAVLIATGLLLAIIALMSRMHNRQTRLAWASAASKVTDMELQLSEAQRARADLESFAYIVSHDLKAPLRGIATLSELIEEDLVDPELEADSRIQATTEYLGRLNQQVTRMDSLIKGIHDYSTGGLDKGLATDVDSAEAVLSVGRLLSIDSGQLVLRGDFPTFRTYSVPFQQTMANLIGNAFKYHDDPENARVEVTVSNFGDFYVFAVSDNGPGIDAAHHDKIFDVFEGIKKPGVESTGVGLSIVKKAVEGLGGMIQVESAPGAGATFRFTWPKTVA